MNHQVGVLNSESCASNKILTAMAECVSDWDCDSKIQNTLVVIIPRRKTSGCRFTYRHDITLCLKDYILLSTVFEMHPVKDSSV